MPRISTPAVITTISSRQDKSLRLSVETPELSSEEKALFMDIQGLNTTILITPEESNDEIVEITSEAEPKSRSEKLRAVLWVLWDRLYKERYPTFTEFYNSKMDVWIEDIKNKIPE
jgi:hypothetical protein